MRKTPRCSSCKSGCAKVWAPNPSTQQKAWLLLSEGLFPLSSLWGRLSKTATPEVREKAVCPV